MSSAGHHSMMGGGVKAPYTPIYGVRSDGVAYCALPGRINSSHGAYEADFSVTQTYSGDWHAWGAHGSSSNRAFFILNLQRPTSNGLYVLGVYADTTSGLQFPVGRYVLAAGNNTMGQYATLNGASCMRSILGDGGINNPGQFLIFRASATNSQTTPQASTSPTFIVLHRLKVWYGDTQVADLIPCRENATNEVCFFNLTDNTFVKNVTSGSLIEFTT